MHFAAPWELKNYLKAANPRTIVKGINPRHSHQNNRLLWPPSQRYDIRLVRIPLRHNSVTWAHAPTITSLFYFDLL